MKIKGTNARQKLPIERRRRKPEMLSGNTKPERVVKKNALRPKADSGKAVAVPRWCGQLRAAYNSQYLDTLIRVQAAALRTDL